jgi:hypothetical protein
MVLATFAGTKVARLPGRNPATQKITGIRDFSIKGATHSSTNAPQRKISREISDKHNLAVWPEP